MMYSMKKLVYIFLIITLYCGCSSNSSTEKHQSKRDNIINVRDRIKEIVIEDVLLNNLVRPQVINKYLFMTDYFSTDEFIHIFDKNNFEYITSTAMKGQGPGEIARIGHMIAEDKVNHKFYVSDYAKYKIFSYDLDSVISDPTYLPVEKMKMSEVMIPNDYKYINDTLSIGLFMEPIGSNDFRHLVGKFNMKTGVVDLMNYTTHPDVKKKRVFFDVSMDQGIYVECYMPHDVITIWSLDGELKYNIYGPYWETETHGMDYFGPVEFCNNKIVVLYTGEKGFKDGKSTSSTKFMIFDLEGNYLKTLETGYSIKHFCYDKDNNRIVMNMDDDMQFTYLDMNGLLN